LFASKDHPTAAVCYNDAVALGLMLGLAARGMRPGRDFALTGFDDIPEAALASPPLTTIATQPRERGRQAAQLLLAQLGAAPVPSRQTTAPAQLQVRESTPPPIRT
jgi:LacI family transcriptional regulator